MKTPAIMHTPSFFSVLFVEEAHPVLVMSSDSRYDRCIEFYKNEDYNGLYNFLSPDKTLKKISGGDIVVDGNEILYKGQPVHNVVVGRIFECIEGKLPYGHLMNFLKNTLESVSFDVLNELYLFLESNESMPIMPDGSFLAYRVVDSNYMSKHRNPDGTQNRNMVGDVVEMARNNVNPDRFTTCAQGLHFCSYNYIPEYGFNDSDRIMIVKVFPQDVIAIPSDYNNSKGRCCKYEVIAEVENYKRDDEDFENRAKSQAKSIAYEYENTGGADCEEVVSKDIFEMVERIIVTQLGANNTTTARRVSKSTKPYVSCKEVVEIAEQLGYKVVEKDVVSLTEISQ